MDRRAAAIAQGAARAKDMAATVRAFEALGTDRAYEWLIGLDLSSQSTRYEIVRELGRFESDDQIRRMAADVCRAQHSTTRTVQRLRKAYSTRTPAERGDALEAALSRCVREHEGRDGARGAWVLEAVDRLRARLAADADAGEAAP